MSRPVETMTWVDVDCSPVDGYKTAITGHTYLAHPWKDLPEPFQDALRTLVGPDFDSASCDAPYCPSRTPDDEPGTPVGYTLAGDADQYQAWHYTALIATGGTVLRVCEDCSPGTIYPPKPQPEGTT